MTSVAPAPSGGSPGSRPRASSVPRNGSFAVAAATMPALLKHSLSKRHFAAPRGAAELEVSSMVPKLPPPTREMTDEEVAEFRECFSVFDSDETGFITLEQLEFIFRGLGQDHTEAEVKQLIAEVDSDKSGTVDFREFLFFLAKNSSNAHANKELRAAFDVFDRNASGKVTLSDVRYVLLNLCYALTSDEVESVLSAATADEDGTIEWEQFKLLFSMGAD